MNMQSENRQAPGGPRKTFHQMQISLIFRDQLIRPKRKRMRSCTGELISQFITNFHENSEALGQIMPDIIDVIANARDHLDVAADQFLLEPLFIVAKTLENRRHTRGELATFRIDNLKLYFDSKCGTW